MYLNKMLDPLSTSKNRGIFLWVALLLCAIIDGAHVFIRYFATEHVYLTPYTSWSAIPRGIIWSILIFDYVRYLIIESVNKKEKYLVLFVAIVWFLNLYSQSNWTEVLGYLVFTAKLTLPILMFRIISKIEDLTVFVKFIIYYFLLQSIIVVLAAILKLPLFRVYAGLRFGYMGLMVGANQLVFVYLTVLTILILSRHYFNSLFFYSTLSIISVSAFCLGTKALWGGLIVFFVFINSELKLPRKKYYLSLFIAFTILVIIILSTDFITQHFYLLINKHGIIGTITSLRNELITNFFIPRVREFNFWNYLFGGVNVKGSFTEMDFLDLFLFSGILGIFALLFVTFKTLFGFRPKSFFSVVFIILYFFIGCFAGHVIHNGLNFIFLPIVCILFQRKNEDPITST